MSRAGVLFSHDWAPWCNVRTWYFTPPAAAHRPPMRPVLSPPPRQAAQQGAGGGHHPARQRRRGAVQHSGACDQHRTSLRLGSRAWHASQAAPSLCHMTLETSQSLLAVLSIMQAKRGTGAWRRLPVPASPAWLPPPPAGDGGVRLRLVRHCVRRHVVRLQVRHQDHDPARQRVRPAARRRRGAPAAAAVYPRGGAVLHHAAPQHRHHAPLLRAGGARAGRKSPACDGTGAVVVVAPAEGSLGCRAMPLRP